ncbi:MAG: hypothetical protein JST28_11985 [Acidobacteria bacterium]|nr:hypothetical protein [Acidobacteriota bacterium]
MGFLRDESGYVLVLGRPRLMAVGAASPAKEETAKRVEIAAKPMVVAACSVPQYCFSCSWCGEQILLPTDRIGSPFGNPDARKVEAQSIATVCMHCKHIANYSMFRNCLGFDTRHRLVHAQRKGETVLLNWLRCAEPLCMKPVPLFVNIDQENPIFEADAERWLWDELTCCLGHRARQISLDPTMQLPLRSASWLR